MPTSSTFFRKLFVHHPILKNRLRPTEKGCMEYIGPRRGFIKTNPLIGLQSGHATIHLRPLIWKEFYGPIPKGQFVHMKCQNNACHEPRHMELLPTHLPYDPNPRQLTLRLSSETIRTILWYRNKVSCPLLAKVLNVKSSAIWGIWNNHSMSDIIIPTNWHPSPALERKIEVESVHFPLIYFRPQTIRLALLDIQRSRTPPSFKEIASRILQGQSTHKIALKKHYTQVWIRYLFKLSLYSFYREYGRREWILLAGKNCIDHWSKKLFRKYDSMNLNEFFTALEIENKSYSRRGNHG